MNSVDGLVNNSVTCILKDSDGFIWIGTNSGLSRYDGSVIVNYKHDSTDSTSLPDNYIHEIQEDIKGNLLIRTSIGYIAYDTRKERFYKDINKYFGISSESIFVDRLYCDLNKNIWIKPKYKEHYLKLDKDTHTLENVFHHQEVTGLQIIDFKDSNGVYYFLYSNGVIEFFDASYNFV